MNDINFSCPYCNQHLAVDAAEAGRSVVCPLCDNQIQIPEVMALHSTIDRPPPLPKQTKECPFCGEEILSKATKCKHCRSMLDGSSTPVLLNTPPTGPNDQDILRQTAFMLLPNERVQMEGIVSYVKGALSCSDSNCYVTNYRLVLSAKGLLGPALFGAVGIAASRLSKSTKITFQIPWGRLVGITKGHHVFHETLTFTTKDAKQYTIKFAFNKANWHTAIRMFTKAAF